MVLPADFGTLIVLRAEICDLWLRAEQNQLLIDLVKSIHFFMAYNNAVGGIYNNKCKDC